MRVFNSPLKLFFRHPVYVLIYVVWLSFMGVFMGLAATDATTDDYVERPTAAVVNRDDGALSAGISQFVAGHSEWVELEDSLRALQDATMQQQVAYIAIIPEGFTDDFMRYAAGEADAPRIETVVSGRTCVSAMMGNLVDEYLSIARTFVIAEPGIGASDVARRTIAAMDEQADVRVVRIADAPPVSARYLMYMQFASYTILLSISVCTSVVMSRFNRDEVRRRNASSPARPLELSLQLAAGCLVIMLVCWAFVGTVGLVALGGGMAGIGAEPIAATLVDLLAYSLFGLALGFLVGQVTGNELAMNAALNVVGLACSFLGGVWISLDLAGEPVATIAKFTPTYYYNTALTGAFDVASPGFSPEYLAAVGMVALFVAALFAVALALARLRRV